LYLAWRTNFGGIADTLSRWWANIQLVYRGVMAVFGTLTDGTGVIRGELARDIEAAGLLGVVTTVARVAYRIREYWLGATGAIGAAWKEAMTILGPTLDVLVDVFGALGEIVGMAASALFGASAATDVSTWRILGDVVGTILGVAFKSLAFSIRLALIPLQGLAGLLRFAIDILQGVDLAEAGRKLIVTWWEGIKSQAGWLYDNFRELLGPLARLLPHSDAKEGPLSTLTASGAAIPDTLGEGVRSAAPRLAATVA
ncbi:phage tail tape measure protein, partial [Desulfocurvibacter africanus]